MNRRRTLLAMAALAVATPRAHGQSAAVRRVGYTSTRPAPNEFEQAFQRGMRERGYVEGTHFVIDYRFSAFDPQAHEKSVAELVATKPDVIVWADGSGVRGVAQAGVPIVMPAMGDPVKSGLTSSLSRPDSNITGVAALTIELSHKRLEILKEALPGLQTVGAVYNARRQGVPQSVAATVDAGKALGIRIVDMRMGLPDEVDARFASAPAQGVQAVVIVSDTSTIAHRTALTQAAMKHRLPNIFANRTYIREAGLMSYGPDLEGAFHRASYFVDRLLKGARPGDLPIEQAQEFKLVVRRSAATTLGITIPQSMLLRAEVI
jgi:putative ABC transport system substrate-binding protein